MTSNGDNSNTGEQGVTRERVSVLSLTYNHETHQVTIGGLPMPLSLAQMICDEGARVLEEQRRIAAVNQLRQAIAQQEADEAIAAALRKRG